MSRHRRPKSSRSHWARPRQYRLVPEGTSSSSTSPTTEVPDKGREPFQPGRYDRRRWAPVLIAWADETSYPQLAGYIAGVGWPQPTYASSGKLVDVTGEVVLDGQQMATAQLPDRGEAQAIVLHELGHLAGLDHTSDKSQIMYSENQFNVRSYADGDLRGLAALGSQSCFPGV